MATLLIVGLSAAGLVVLGWRIIAIGAAIGWRAKLTAVRKCIVDWSLSLGLASAGALCGGVLGGVAGLVSGPILSWMVSRKG